MGRTALVTKTMVLPVAIEVSEDGVMCGACKLWTAAIWMNGREMERVGGFCTAFEKKMYGKVSRDCGRLPECLAATKEI